MIKKLLIANRGEIACRIIRTAKRLGIETYALYSDADRFSPHCRLADNSVYLGPSPASESYLNADKIVAIAQQKKIDAIHPGYGFLSENSAFSKACEQAGIRFVGPTAKTIEAMAYKDKAKEIMSKAGIPVVPGFHKSGATPAELTAAAMDIGFPLLIKASAGGGGKGMRIVEIESDLNEAIERAQSEALKFFNSDEVILEKYLPAPRHIEVQIFADTHGNVVHLFERDCSVQRRYQKIIEEAPATDLCSTLRKDLHQAAVGAAKAVDYIGAGTVEFLVDGSDFYFMEMNTRLQVEHPVTEAITGLDLVEWQLQIANGPPLPLQQGEIQQNGYAVEARIYAEDARNDFMPSTGLVENLSFPEQHDMRVDFGFEQGNRVSLYYDPMLGKMICHADTRVKALQALQQALKSTLVSGIETNISYLVVLIDNLLASGDLPSTQWLEKNEETIELGLDAITKSTALLGILVLCRQAKKSDCSPWSSLGHWRHGQSQRLSGSCWIDGTQYQYQFSDDEQTIKLYFEDDEHLIQAVDMTSNRVTALVDGECHTAYFGYRGETLLLVSSGKQLYIEKVEPNQCTAGAGGDNSLKAPMTAQVVHIHCQPGDKVVKGETLMVLEAMKMEHSIKSPQDGIVESILYQTKDLVEEGKQLVNLKPS